MLALSVIIFPLDFTLGVNCTSFCSVHVIGKTFRKLIMHMFPAQSAYKLFINNLMEMIELIIRNNEASSCFKIKARSNRNKEYRN